MREVFTPPVPVAPLASLAAQLALLHIGQPPAESLVAMPSLGITMGENISKVGCSHNSPPKIGGAGGGMTNTCRGYHIDKQLFLAHHTPLPFGHLP